MRREVRRQVRILAHDMSHWGSDARKLQVTKGRPGFATTLAHRTRRPSLGRSNAATTNQQT